MRTRLWSRAVLVGLAVGLAVVLSAGAALAGHPVPGAHYFGFPGAASAYESYVDATGELVVSRGARRVASATLNFYCPGSAPAVPARLSGSAGHAVRIAHDGHFATEERRNLDRYRARYRLRGRFVTKDYARIVYSERRLRSRRLVCRSVMRLYRNGVPPFSGCRSQRAHTDLWADSGRVLQQYTLSPGGGGEFRLGTFSTHLYTCLFDEPSKRIDLGENYAPDDYRENFRLAGPFVAFLRHECAMCIPWDQAWIEVRDARDGSLARKPDVAWGSRLTDVELGANGSVGWTLDRVAMGPDGYPIGYGGGQPPTAVAWEVWALDSHGQRLLDSGPNLDLHSLALNGSTLTWINNGATRSATLD